MNFNFLTHFVKCNCDFCNIPHNKNPDGMFLMTINRHMNPKKDEYNNNKHMELHNNQYVACSNCKNKFVENEESLNYLN